MILQLRDLNGIEYTIGVADGGFVSPDAVDGPTRDFRHLHAVSGLADCHAHLTGDDVQDMIGYDGTDLLAKMRRNALIQMENGVLLLADKGSKTSLSLRFLDEEAASRPHLQMAGSMIAVADGYYPGFGAVVEGSNLGEVIAAAVQGGASWVKLVGDWPRRGRGPVANFSEQELAEVVAISHAAGCRVAIHTTAPFTPGIAVRAGVDSIEHGLYLTVADIAELGERGGAWVPTIGAMESTADWLGTESSGGKMFRTGLANVKTLLAEAVDAGVAVLAGTDLALSHGSVAEEAARLHDYGLSRRRAVDAVTASAYEYLGVARGFVAGNMADLVLFEQDPRQDLAELQRPAHVMRAGRVVVSSIS